MTPFATIQSILVTLAALTNISPSCIVIVIFSPCIVLKLVPFVSSGLYPTNPCTIWYSNSAFKSSAVPLILIALVAFASATAELGMKYVTSGTSMMPLT
jgi:hypothetical protein